MSSYLFSLIIRLVILGLLVGGILIFGHFARKKAAIIIIAVALIVFLVPFVQRFKDGGTVEYSSPIYRIISWHKEGVYIQDNGDYEDIYNLEKTDVQFFPCNLKSIDEMVQEYRAMIEKGENVNGVRIDRVGRFDDANYVGGKRYRCTSENASAANDLPNRPFYIDLRDDGTACYTQPVYSSYAPIAKWSIEDGLLVIRDADFDIVNYFDIIDGNLVYRAEGSKGFMFYHFDDGEVFERYTALDYIITDGDGETDLENRNESAQIGTLFKFRYSPGYSDMNGASHQTELARDDEGKWTITDRDRDDIANPVTVTTWSADDEAVSEFIKCLSENDFLSLATRPESNSFMDDYSPWGYFIMIDNSSIGGGKRDHYNIGQYKEYSDADYELIKTVQKRFEELKGNKLSETVENE